MPSIQQSEDTRVTFIQRPCLPSVATYMLIFPVLREMNMVTYACIPSTQRMIQKDCICRQFSSEFQDSLGYIMRLYIKGREENRFLQC